MKQVKMICKGQKRISQAKRLLAIVLVVVLGCSLIPLFGVTTEAVEAAEWTGATNTGDTNALIADNSSGGVDITFQDPDYNANSFACYTPVVNPADLCVDLSFNNWNMEGEQTDIFPDEGDWYALSILNQADSKFSLGGADPTQEGIVLLMRPGSKNSVIVECHDETLGGIAQTNTKTVTFSNDENSRVKNISFKFLDGNVYIDGELAFSVNTSVDKLGTEAYLGIGAHSSFPCTAELTVNSVGTDNSGSETTEEPTKYIMFQMTNTPYFMIEAQLKKLQKTYGPNNVQSDTLYAFGMCGPMLLTQSPEVIADAINQGFDLALEYDIPVYFQMDDVTNYTDLFGSGAEEWYLDDDNVEKYGFGPDAVRAKYWYNWGAWRTSPATACLNSEKFVAFVKKQIAEGVAPVLTQRYNELKAAGKEYLFAGIAVGWETQIPDYNPTLHNISVANPPVDQDGVVMTSDEMGQTGYRALENLGYTDESLTAEAIALGIDKDDLIRQILTEVQTEYTTMISKAVYDRGIPRTKIFTHIVALRSTESESITTHHPEISTAVNIYSTPGFTMSPITCPYNIDVLKEEIQKVDPTQEYFANTEGYAAGFTSYNRAQTYFSQMFDNGALLVSVFGYTDPESSTFGVPKNSDAPFNQVVLNYTQSTPSYEEEEEPAGDWIIGEGVVLTELDNRAVRVYSESPNYNFESYIITKETVDPTNIQFDILFEDVSNMIGKDAWIVVQLSQEQSKFAISGGSRTNAGYGLMIQPGTETHKVELLRFNENGALDTLGTTTISIAENDIYTFSVNTEGSSTPELYINGEMLTFSGDVQFADIVGLAGSDAYLGVLMHIATGGAASLQVSGLYEDAEPEPIKLVTSRDDITITEDTVIFNSAITVGKVKELVTPSDTSASIKILKVNRETALDTDIIENGMAIEVMNVDGQTVRVYAIVVKPECQTEDQTSESQSEGEDQSSESQSEDEDQTSESQSGDDDQTSESQSGDEGQTSESQTNTRSQTRNGDQDTSSQTGDKAKNTSSNKKASKNKE